MNRLEKAIQAKIDGKTKPVGALGRLEGLAVKIARLQGRLDPRMQRARHLIFAADHGLVAEGVSSYPQEVTRQMVLNFLRGGAAANVFANLGGLYLSVVNAGVRGGSFGDRWVIEESLGEGTANCLHEPAMSPAQCRAALAAGRRIGAEGDWDAIAFGEMGIGNSSSAALLAHRLTDAPLENLVGRGAGMDGEGLLHKHDVLRRVSDRVPGKLGPEAGLTEFGGFEIAMMAGAMQSAAEARRVVLVDGYISTVAALVAAQMVPAAREAMVFCHLSGEPGHRVVLETMGARPLLDLGMRLGEGTGAALAWPLVRASVAMLNDMASFDEAGVSGPA